MPSHVAPETPGSIHEGGELGYSLSHAHGAAFDNPGLIVACAVGDGEAETGPLATSWHSHRFLDPARDGAVLPILHLNGWKIANPAVLARIPDDELDALLRGYGYEPRYVTGHEPSAMHQDMAAALDDAIAAIRAIQRQAREGAVTPRPGAGQTSIRWPMIVLRSPKGWTGPAVVDGRPVEGTWRAHQVPLAEVRTNPEHLRQLEEWMRSYRPEELFDAEGRPREDLLGLVPEGDRRMGANPHANGGLLTGRHGMFSCYEAFIHIVDSMFNQHAKWLKVTRKLPWRRPVASLNYLLTSHVWRQDHNGFSHQDPGFIDHVVNKKAEVIRVYLPPDANTLLSVADHCLRSRNYVNVIVYGKQPSPDWLDMDSAVLHCTRGAGIWEWASSDGPGQEPDVVLACAGDVPTLEVLAATDILRRHLPELRVRVVNVVDLMRLEPDTEHPHGMKDAEFDALFTTDRPVIFAYHGYPWLIHRLTYSRAGHNQFHVRGYIEEGTTTTPFDMVVMNNMDRFHLVMDVIDRVPGLGNSAAWLRQQMADSRTRHWLWIREHGEDLPEVSNWTWGGSTAQP